MAGINDGKEKCAASVGAGKIQQWGEKGDPSDAKKKGMENRPALNQCPGR